MGCRIKTHTLDGDENRISIGFLRSSEDAATADNAGHAWDTIHGIRTDSGTENTKRLGASKLKHEHVAFSSSSERKQIAPGKLRSKARVDQTETRLRFQSADFVRNPWMKIAAQKFLTRRPHITKPRNTG